MPSLREAATLALEALQTLKDRGVWGDFDGVADALKAALVEDAMQKFTDVSQEIEAALAEPVQEPADSEHLTTGSEHFGSEQMAEPIAWYHVPYPNNGAAPMVSLSQQREPSMYGATVPLYLGAPQRKPLTDEEIRGFYYEHAKYQEAGARVSGWWEFARAIERAHNIKE